MTTRAPAVLTTHSPSNYKRSGSNRNWWKKTAYSRETTPCSSNTPPAGCVITLQPVAATVSSPEVHPQLQPLFFVYNINLQNCIFSSKPQNLNFYEPCQKCILHVKLTGQKIWLNIFPSNSPESSNLNLKNKNIRKQQ